MNIETVTIRFGSGSSEIVEIELPCECDDPTTSSAYRFARVRVRAGKWSGEFGTILSAKQLIAFREGLRALHRDLVGTVLLDTAPDEGGMRFELKGDARGHLAGRMKIAIQLQLKLECEFEFQMDQTFLPEIIASLDRVIHRMST